MGPQPESFREQLERIIQAETKKMQNAMMKEEESVSKEEYFASDNEDSDEEMIVPSRQRKRKTHLDLFLESLPSIKAEDEIVDVPKGQICRHNLEEIFA